MANGKVILWGAAIVGGIYLATKALKQPKGAPEPGSLITQPLLPFPALDALFRNGLFSTVTGTPQTRAPMAPFPSSASSPAPKTTESLDRKITRPIPEPPSVLDALAPGDTTLDRLANDRTGIARLGGNLAERATGSVLEGVGDKLSGKSSTVDLFAKPANATDSTDILGAASNVFKSPGAGSVGELTSTVGRALPTFQGNPFQVARIGVNVFSGEDGRKAAFVETQKVAVQTLTAGLAFIPIVGAGISAAVGALAGTGTGKKVFAEGARVAERGVKEAQRVLGISAGSSHSERVAQYTAAAKAVGVDITPSGGLVYIRPSTLTAEQTKQTTNSEAFAKDPMKYITAGKLADGSTLGPRGGSTAVETPEQAAARIEENRMNEYYAAMRREQNGVYRGNSLVG